jgi:hypothetical protein
LVGKGCAAKVSPHAVGLRHGRFDRPHGLAGDAIEDIAEVADPAGHRFDRLPDVDVSQIGARS